MSRAPFSKPDANDVVSSSHLFKIRSSLNHWSRGRLPESRGKHLFGIVVIALLLLGLQLTACGNTTPSTSSSASPTSDTTSQRNTPSTTSTPGSTSASTAEPNTGSTEVPIADPSSFTITQGAGLPICFTGTAGQSDVDPSSPSFEIQYQGSANPAPGPINWTVSALAQGKPVCQDADGNTPPCTIFSSNWLSFNPSSGSISYNSPQQTVTIQASHTADMQAGVYCTKLQFNPVNSDDKDSAYAELIIVAASSGPSVSGISPNSGPAAGGTDVTIMGTGFIMGSTSVSFGGAAASNVTVVSDTQITATSPAGSGTADVTVTTPNGTSATGASAQFTYT